jgi:hypothetical protein
VVVNPFIGNVTFPGTQVFGFQPGVYQQFANPQAGVVVEEPVQEGGSKVAWGDVDEAVDVEAEEIEESEGLVEVPDMELPVATEA